ncbi:MAG: family transposase [Sphingobacterium sp.]|jgi:transposase-like protein|nr:family transposase [Sphingobacterium sp.]
METIFPKAKFQKCIVHQFRTSMRYLAENNKKHVLEDLKQVIKQ